MWCRMAKLFAGEATPHEEAEVDVSVKTDDELMAEFDLAKETWERAGYAAKFDAIDADAAFGTVLQQIDGRQKRQIRMRYLSGIAAVLTLCIVVGAALWYPWGNIGRAGKMQMSLAEDGVVSLTLADGSGVDLNKGSQLVYPETFNTSQRNVKLKGEAFFNVAPNKQVPFVIDAGLVSVKVVGTSFNVKANAQSNTVAVTVRDGVVEVRGKSDVVVLTQGQVAVFNAETGLITKSLNNNINYNAWLTKELLFDETPLSDVFQVLEDVYHIRFVMHGHKLAQAKWTASFHQKDAGYVVKVLAMTFNAKVTKTDDGYLFEEK
jgi:transmembrane sensor